MTFLKIALAASALVAAPAAFAQTAAPADTASSAIVTGATVLGNDGNPVGTVESIAGEVVVINTGKHRAPVPASAIATGEGRLSVNIAKAQLDEMMDKQVAQAAAKRDAALVTGAAVVAANGTPAGTLAEVDLAADTIVLASPAGKVALKKEHFAIDGEGRLMALFTREQIETAAAGAAGGAGSSGASN
ncbi:MAG: hypothetical protein MUF47_14095 [Porphyrobacter sp.]|jgi:hypothetical protein|nr:hypothetical protein [Porphyrobacter sp.]